MAVLLVSFLVLMVLGCPIAFCLLCSGTFYFLANDMALIMVVQRLTEGAYQWPRSESEVKTLTPQQYRWLMEGLQIEQPKAHRPVTGLSTV